MDNVFVGQDLGGGLSLAGFMEADLPLFHSKWNGSILRGAMGTIPIGGLFGDIPGPGFFGEIPVGA